MEQANADYASLHELLDRSGELVAGMLGTEAAYVSTGTAGGLVLAIAATICGSDPARIQSIPDMTGMRDEVLIQGPVRWLYERTVTQSGARLVRAGSRRRCTADDIEAAITDRTAAIIHVARPRPERETDELIDLGQLLEIGKRRGIPVVVDAAGPVFPLDTTLRWQAQHGDLVCFGSKYINGPNSAGYVCGRADLIDAVRAQDFVAFDEVGVSKSMVASAAA